MKTNAKKEIIICVITLIILAFTMTKTFATQPVTDPNEIRNLVSGGNTNQLTNENASNIQEGENRNTNTNTNTNKTNTKNTTNNVNTNTNGLPNTGLENPSIIIVTICIISAIYAYKKIRDYKNI